jgi:endo-1,4-beta-xylanase
VLDRFGALGKPIHISAMGVPSGVTPDALASLGGGPQRAVAGGTWHKPWDEVIQSDWVDQVCRIAIGKPFVTSISWRDYSDHQPHAIPHGGLLRRDTHPKIAFQRLLGLRKEIWPEAHGGEAESNVVWPDA